VKNYTKIEVMDDLVWIIKVKSGKIEVMDDYVKTQPREVT